MPKFLAARTRLAAVGAVVALLLAVAGAAALLSQEITAPSPQEPQAIVDAPLIYQAVAAVLSPDTKREAKRLARATIDQTGDATVVFALRNEGDDLKAVRASALLDTLAVLWGVYHSPEADRVATSTVVGTFAIMGERGKARELPVLRAVLSAERAAQVNWAVVTPEGMPELVDAWWLHPVFAPLTAARGEPTPIASAPGVDTEGREHIPLTLPDVRDQVDLMLLHLNEALFALSGNNVGIARSQFKQFFEEWDGAEEEVRVLYPERHEALDLELERAETALLHRSPEDVDMARFALRALRAGLVEVASDLEARLEKDE